MEARWEEVPRVPQLIEWALERDKLYKVLLYVSRSEIFKHEYVTTKTNRSLHSTPLNLTSTRNTDVSENVDVSLMSIV